MSTPEKVLIIDDEELVRNVLRAGLESMGLAVVEAEGGEQGLARCLRERPDLVLLDVGMPGISGFDTCRAIKAHPEVADTPVLYLTGRVGQEELMEGFASGGVDFIGKPFRLSELKARVQAHLEIRRQRRQLERSRCDLQEALSEIRRDHLLLLEVHEKLRATEAVKGHFIAHMRSELNDPLGSILGLTDQIGDPRLSLTQYRELAVRIKEEAFQLDFHLRNIFSAAELEAGEARPYLTQVDVESVMKDVAATFGQRLQAHGQSLALDIPGCLGPLQSDAEKIRIILANLVANAVEFSPVGGHIEFRASRQGDSLVFEVADKGCGLSEAQQAVIFERFRQVDTGHDRKHRGQGLGLAVAKTLAELLEGEISVTSVPGRGSTFTCRLPLQPEIGNPDTFAFDGNLFIFDEPSES